MNNPADTALVIIPTYNEIENLPLITGRLRAAQPDVDVLIVDDNSPDGTGAKADELAAADSAVHVLHRTEKSGLLGAYLAGFEWGLARDYQVLVEMDADGYITLLPPGEEIAARIYDRHQLLTEFLRQLGVSPENAAADACKLEHDISEESYERIKEATRRKQAER